MKLQLAILAALLAVGPTSPMSAGGVQPKAVAMVTTNAPVAVESAVVRWDENAQPVLALKAKNTASEAVRSFRIRLHRFTSKGEPLGFESFNLEGLAAGEFGAFERPLDGRTLLSPSERVVVVVSHCFTGTGTWTAEAATEAARSKAIGTSEPTIAGAWTGSVAPLAAQSACGPGFCNEERNACILDVCGRGCVSNFSCNLSSCSSSCSCTVPCKPRP
jgi:hypothetical protein